MNVEIIETKWGKWKANMWIEEKRIQASKASNNTIKIIMHTWKQIDNIVFLCHTLYSLWILNFRANSGWRKFATVFQNIRSSKKNYATDNWAGLKDSCTSANIMEFPYENHHKFVDCAATFPKLLFSGEIKWQKIYFFCKRTGFLHNWNKVSAISSQVFFLLPMNLWFEMENEAMRLNLRWLFWLPCSFRC